MTDKPKPDADAEVILKRGEKAIGDVHITPEGCAFFRRVQLEESYMRIPLENPKFPPPIVTHKIKP